MTILRLDLDAGGWRPVPPGIFEDKRLSLDARAVAGYLSTRSETFTFRISGLCTLLKIGEEKWRRISLELTTAGYLKKNKAKDARGRFKFELLFSPVPDGGFPTTSSGQSGRATPKLLPQPDMDKRALAPPSSANSGSTIEKNNIKNEYHHQQASGSVGGDTSGTDSKFPPHWIEAVNFEMGIEAKARPIQNHAGLFKTIIDRYLANGGPPETTIQAMEYAKKFEAEREAKANATQEQARQDQERADMDAKRHSEAETRAKAISCDARKILLLEVQKKVRNEGNTRVQTAFLERGEILLGPLRLPLIQSLLPDLT